MIALNIKHDINAVRVKLFELRADIVDKATVRAINKVADQVKSGASREIRQSGYNMKAAAIKRQIIIKKASNGNPVALVRCTGRPIPLIEFSARQTSQGVSVNVKNGRKIFKGAFIATMPTGHKGVYVRVGKQHEKVMRRGRNIWSGLPIEEKFGPGISDAFGNEVVQSALVRLVKEKFSGILEHEIKYLAR